MTMTDDLRILAQQLDEAWADWSRGEGDAFEIAAVAGLLDRVDPDVAALRSTRERLDDLQGALDDLDAEGLVDALADLDEDDEPEVVDRALFDLDEVCAAATFLGDVAMLVGPVDLAVRTIRAFPEPFARRSALASEILARRSPRAGDPSLPLWQAVEAAAGSIARR